MEKTITIQRNKIFFIILLSIFIFSAFFLNYLNVSAASGYCSLFGCGSANGCCHTNMCCGNATGCCGTSCCNKTSGSCGSTSCSGGTSGTCSLFGCGTANGCCHTNMCCGNATGCCGTSCCNKTSGSCGSTNCGGTVGSCTPGKTQSCSVNGCPGTQFCSVSGKWDSCKKNDPCCNQSCPPGSTCVKTNLGQGYQCVLPCKNCGEINCGGCKSMGYKCKCSSPVSGGYESCELVLDLSCCKEPCYVENGECKGECGTWGKTCGSPGFMCCEDGCKPGLSCCQTTVVVNGIVLSGPKVCLSECPGNPISSCNNGDIKPCTTSDNCPGKRTCTNNVWGILCVDIPNDNCPPPPPPNSPPNAAMSCQTVDCPGCECNGTWTTFNGDGVYIINNDSNDPDDNIVKSTWSIIGYYQDPYLTCSPPNPLCNMTMPKIPAGNYSIKLKVEDAGGFSDEIFHVIKIKQDAIADFDCSLNGEDWEACEGLVVYQDQLIYLKCKSTASDGAVITSRTWKINNVVFNSGNNAATTSVNLAESENIITLVIGDSQGRSDSEDKTIEAGLPLPEYHEVPPTIWLKKFFAGIINFFDGFLKI